MHPKVRMASHIVFVVLIIAFVVMVLLAHSRLADDLSREMKRVIFLIAAGSIMASTMLFMVMSNKYPTPGSKQAAKKAFLDSLDEQLQVSIRKYNLVLPISLGVSLLIILTLAFWDSAFLLSSALFGQPESIHFVPFEFLFGLTILAIISLNLALSLAPLAFRGRFSQAWREYLRHDHDSERSHVVVTWVGVLFIIVSLSAFALSLGSYIRMTNEGIAIRALTGASERKYVWTEVERLEDTATDKSDRVNRYRITFADGRTWAPRMATNNRRLRKAMEYVSERTGKPIETAYLQDAGAEYQ